MNMNDENKRKREFEKKEVVRKPYFKWWQDTPMGLPELYTNWIWLTGNHVFGIGYFVLSWFGVIERSTLLFEIFYGYLGGFGITVGCHRYWSHKTFKANLPLQILLMIMQTIAGQYPIHKWCLEHRMHHKYMDTNSDPYNSKRGLMFSHVGWLYLPRHPDFVKKRKYFRMDDLENDPIVQFQSKYFFLIKFIFHTALPVLFIHYFYELSLPYAVACNCRRYIVILHITWSVNSFAHKWGDKPYNRNISPVNTAPVSLFALGEGWHNYHHTFPWDYKTSEFGWTLNPSTMLIDFFAWLGWASELKTVSKKMLKERMHRTGDLKQKNNDKENLDFHAPSDVAEEMKILNRPLWGWDDGKMTKEFRNITTILHIQKKA